MIIKDLTDTDYICDYCDDRSCSICTLLSALRKARHDAMVVNSYKDAARENDKKYTNETIENIIDLSAKDAFFCDIILSMSDTAKKRLEWFNNLEESIKNILEARKKLKDKVQQQAQSD